METVLIYRLGSLGDTIVALPCFHKIAECFPDARRVVLTNRPVSKAAPGFADVLAGSGLVHETIEYKVGTRSARDLLQLGKTLSSLKIDRSVYLTAPRGRTAVYRDLAFFRTCGITQVIGAPVSNDLLRNRIDPVTGEEEYECERLARSISVLGAIDLQSRSSWDLHLTPAEHEAADRHLAPLRGERFFAFNMGGKQVHNDWGHENWLALMTQLAEHRPHVPLVFIGGAQDAERADTALSRSAARIGLNLCGKLSPRCTASALTRARLFVGHDSGPLHLAAASNVRCIGLFNARSRPHKWHPYGAGNQVFRFEPSRSGEILGLLLDAILEASY